MSIKFYHLVYLGGILVAVIHAWMFDLVYAFFILVILSIGLVLINISSERVIETQDRMIHNLKLLIIKLKKEKK